MFEVATRKVPMDTAVFVMFAEVPKTFVVSKESEIHAFPRTVRFAPETVPIPMFEVAMRKVPMVN
jgi:hypothetical protein